MASFATQKSRLWVVQETDVCSRCPAVCCSCSSGTIQPSSNSSTSAQWGMLSGDLCNSRKCWSALCDGNTSDPVFFWRNWVYSSHVIDILVTCNKFEATWENLTHLTLPKCQKCSVLILDTQALLHARIGSETLFCFSISRYKILPIRQMGADHRPVCPTFAKYCTV